MFLVLKQNLNPFYWCIWLHMYSKGRHEASFHPFVSSFIRPFVRSSIHPIMVCLLRWGGERVKYRRDAAGKCTVKYTHTCALGTGLKLVSIKCAGPNSHGPWQLLPLHQYPWLPSMGLDIFLVGLNAE